MPVNERVQAEKKKTKTKSLEIWVTVLLEAFVSRWNCAVFYRPRFLGSPSGSQRVLEVKPSSIEHWASSTG